MPSIFFIVYCGILIKILVFKSLVIKIGHLVFNFSGQTAGQPNFIPFKTILPYLLGEKGLVIAAFNIGGNIALLIPMGFLAPLVYKNITWQKTIALSLILPFAIEIAQVLLHVGIFDIDDVILNALGVIIGYWVYTKLIKQSSHT